jgi:hypothetical protein
MTFPFRVFIIGCLLLLGAIGYCTAAHCQTVPPKVTLPTMLDRMDNATYVMPITQGHPFCWSNGNNQTNLSIKLYRYRLEGGYPKALYLTLPYNLWVRSPDNPPANVPPLGNYCTSGTHMVPKAGHWIYEAKICWTPTAVDDSNCSDLVSAACPAGTPGCAGAVADVPRGWWVYAFLPAPGGIGVN